MLISQKNRGQPKTRGVIYVTLSNMTSDAPLYGVDFVFKRERREERAQRRSCLKGLQRLQQSMKIGSGSDHRVACPVNQSILNSSIHLN